MANEGDDALDNMRGRDEFPQRALEELEDVKETLDRLTGEHNDGLTNLELKLTEIVSALHGEVEALKQQLKAARLAERTDHVTVRETKIEGPKPKEFRGDRNAQDVENFLWRMEDYFEHLNIVDEAAKVRAATMYLTDTAMLWWRRKMADMEKGICSIKSWGKFKHELKRQFYPQNIVNEARRKLRELKQTTSIREYVKEFTKLILQIPNMSSEDLLFYFMDGLQGWAKQELQRRQVKDVDEAIAVAESLTDFRTESTKAKDTKGKPTKPGGDRAYRDKGKQAAGPSRDFKGEGNRNSHWRNRYNERKKANGPHNGCYLCKDPSHFYKDCPTLGKFGAIIAAERRQADGAAQANAQAGEAAAQDKHDVAHLGHMMLGALLTKEPALKQAVRDKPGLAQMGQTLLGAVMGREPRLRQKGSLFVDARLNGQHVRIMVDTGTTHNFVTEAKAKSLGLVFSPSSSLLKTVNADLTNVNGVACSTTWSKPDLYLGSEGPCVVPTVRVPQVVGQLSAMQIVKGFKRGEATFLAAVTEIEEDKVDETLPPCVQQVLVENKNVMPEELPKRLPPRREVDHQIELIPGAKPPAMGPYRMAPPELEELRKQLKELLEAGHVRPSKAPF
uniref:Retrotransposon gag domain-containing protein n=1 Tax=Nicotiana tabacum TaxID=4097 RepID=A0A1S4CAI9_TOBAC|nr:PREDICTED: uncharacterized protein LOC107816746 [Nicotiana tabacum]